MKTSTRHGENLWDTEIMSVGNNTDVFGSIIQGCDSILEQSQHLAQLHAIFCGVDMK